MVREDNNQNHVSQVDRYRANNEEAAKKTIFDQIDEIFEIKKESIEDKIRNMRWEYKINA